MLSLAAVFLALGLGVLVGVSLSGSGTVQNSQTGLVKDIQRDLDDLRNQNDLLAREKAHNLRFQEDSFPYMVAGRLQGKKIAVVASDKTGDELLRQVVSAIHASGAQIVSTTILNSRFDPKAVADKLKGDLKADPSYATLDASSFAAIGGQHFAREIAGKAGPQKMITAAQGLLVASATGSYEVPVDDVILITRADDEQAPAYSDLEKQFLLNLKSLAVRSIGAETSDAPRSEIPLFLSVDVSSVDNLESRIGQLSLIFALSGEKGSFGTKTTADMLIPILRAPKQPITTPAQ